MRRYELIRTSLLWMFTMWNISNISHIFIYQFGDLCLVTMVRCFQFNWSNWSIHWNVNISTSISNQSSKQRQKKIYLNFKPNRWDKLSTTHLCICKLIIWFINEQQTLAPINSINLRFVFLCGFILSSSSKANEENESSRF